MGTTAWIGSGAAVLAAAAAMAAPAAHAQSAYSSVYTNPPLIVQPAPVRTWVPGHWEQHHFGHVWVEGHWVVVQQQPGHHFHNFNHSNHFNHHTHRHSTWQGARMDHDRDGIPNRVDRDIDGDGVPNWRDRSPRGGRR
jgi:WXXGXW repeat (2 copies)